MFYSLAVLSADNSPYHFKKSFNIGSEPTLAVLQDPNDFLWFGSFFSGPVRFDSINVTAIKAGDNSITSNFVTQLYKDNQGLIWVGTVNGLTIRLCRLLKPSLTGFTKCGLLLIA